ncbi:hypothetical protein Q4603_05690 [Zobellia galactanivorans]|uniref:hypothetical protein n=1 Tax=Zobellia galactanivorans (strain DSM 12802 / CCUG 47099 / CIP 106680 / NCIMB 13871 / Dsij) TaxID=63186 RepID=UPI0026E356A5|nr:hypothetical protein [Zobellia galactanivorans]MDO6808087.1 hypothetical protein [Zobellia galactanivorans]
MTKEQVAEYAFKLYPKEDKVFITSDKQAFFIAEQAEAHAPRLKDKKITTFTRKEKVDKHVPGTEIKQEARLSGEGLVKLGQETASKDDGAKGSGKAEDDDSPKEGIKPVEYSMNNTKDQLLEAAKGLEVSEEMTKAQILAVLYPEDDKE